MGRAKDRLEGGTHLAVPALPGARQPQSLPQDLPELESAGPAGGFALALRQQHLPWLRQQEQEADALSDWTASGAREAQGSSSPKQAATMRRVQLWISPRPSIPWQGV